MKLCILKPDGLSAEILLKNTQPSLDIIDNQTLFFENYFYKIIIREDEAVDNVELFVGEYSIPLNYDSISGCFETDRCLVFGGCFDLACVSVSFNTSDGNEKIYYTDYLRIATTKQTARQVEKMLEEIEKNLPNYLEICYSKSLKRSGLIKREVRSIWNTFKIVDEIIKIYEENYGYFNNCKKSFIEQSVAIVDAKAMKSIDQDSLRWISSNPDNLIQTNKPNGIVIDKKRYFPSKVKTYISHYSYDLYENKVVLGFLKSVIIYIETQITGFDKEINELENIPKKIVVQLPNTHELTGRCIYIYYKGLIEKLLDRKIILLELFYRYEKIFSCTPEILVGTPKLTNTFKQVYHYRLCYECMIRWFEAGDYSFDHLNYLFKLKTLSRIFEYYCLIKLQLAIIQSGYSFKQSEKIVYDIDEDMEDINNKYVFVGKGYEISLLYEPYIWVNKSNVNLNLYSTGYNFLKGKWNDKWTPDFILKITTDIKEYYYILDAKYSSAANVKKRYIPELVLKYSTQIASMDKFYSDVIGIGAIYPDEQDKLYNFKKNEVNSQKQSLPMFFSLSIVEDIAGNEALKNRMNELIQIIDNVEREIDQDMQYNTGKKVLVNNKMSKTEAIPNFLDVQKDNDNMPIQTEKNGEKVNGKRCFYYARGMCLCQKKRCMIIESPCEFFIYKNSKNLLVEEDSCRNFIRYLRRGKIYRVECSISGLPGCIGSENCKFCLKKKNSNNN